ATTTTLDRIAARIAHRRKNIGPEVCTTRPGASTSPSAPLKGTVDFPPRSDAHCALDGRGQAPAHGGPARETCPAALWPCVADPVRRCTHVLRRRYIVLDLAARDASRQPVAGDERYVRVRSPLSRLDAFASEPDIDDGAFRLCRLDRRADLSSDPQRAVLWRNFHASLACLPAGISRLREPDSRVERRLP